MVRWRRCSPSGHGRRSAALAAVVAVVAAIVPAVVVYACIGVVSLEATPTTAQPGGSVTLSGKDFAPGSPILVHLDSADGPVIFTVPSFQGDSMTSHFSVTMPIPSNVAVGAHVLVATQAEHDMNGGTPARAVLYVGTAAGPQPAPPARPATAAVDDGPGIGGLALIALAAAAFTGLVFALAAVMAGRRSGPTEASAGA